MVKKIIIDEEINVREGQSTRSRGHRNFDEGFSRHHSENYRKGTRSYGPKIVETRLFVSKDELVKYVNEKGKSDALIDIYKIEDELYKLVIKK